MKPIIRSIPVLSAENEIRGLWHMANQGILPLSPYYGRAYGQCLPLILPTKCSVCNEVFGSSVVPITSVHNCDADSKECDVISVYRCLNCNSLFAMRYRLSVKRGQLLDVSVEEQQDKVTCTVIGYLPIGECPEDFSDYVKDTFPEFVDFYRQAYKAESLGLSGICGMGYRKALEFLMDSYVRILEKDLPEDFSTFSLSKKISDYVDDDNIKHLAKGASWIGNDETHVVRKQPDYTIDEMKDFIMTIVRFIEYKYQCQKANDMISKK